MDFQRDTSAEAMGFGDALDQAAIEFADSVTDGLSRATQEALQDPLIGAIMAADKVDRKAFSEMLRHISSTLYNAPGRPCYHC